MDLPAWVQDIIRHYEAPATGKVVITLERYQGGVTNMEVGGFERFKAGGATVKPGSGDARIVGSSA